MKLFLLLALTTAASPKPMYFNPRNSTTRFSSAHPPVLRIKPGDHVVTFTIDARGIDSAGVQRGAWSESRDRSFLY